MILVYRKKNSLVFDPWIRTWQVVQLLVARIGQVVVRRRLADAALKRGTEVSEVPLTVVTFADTA